MQDDVCADGANREETRRRQGEDLAAVRTAFCRGDPANARALAEQYLTAWPGCTVGWTILAKLCETAGDWEHALRAVRHLCTLQPEVAWSWSFLGLLLKRQGRLSEAEQALSQSLRLDPRDAETLNLRGIVLMSQGQPAAAEGAFRQAVAVNAKLAEGWNNLGTALRDLDRLDESMLSFWQALALSPENGRARSNLLFSQAFTAALTLERQRAEAEMWEREVLSAEERACASAWRFPRTDRQGQRLRLGIVSAEFGRHAVGHFLLSWLRALDRDRLTLYLYPSLQRPEPEAERFRELADVWVPLASLSDVQATERIRADGIDVLMETSGHTEHHRLGVIARRAAPVQCHYIGYFATTGLTEMDYFIADEVLVPPAHDHHFSERIWRLPRSRYAYQPLQRAPEPQWRPAADGSIRLGSFNNLTKVRQESLLMWGSVLRALPRSHLILKDRRATDPSVQARILEQLVGQGISPSRIQFVPASGTWTEHMAAYDQIDIALDSLPFNSATTGFDALWMGVPLVTRIGDRLAGRQAASLLSGFGRPEWIAETNQDFVRIVTELAADQDRLASIRAHQRNDMLASELCDGPGLARVLEQTFARMLDISPRIRDTDSRIKNCRSQIE